MACRVPPAALASLLALTLVRLLVAGLVPLSPDEAYYWTWSRALAPGYLDHPPMVALWIRAGTALAGDTRLGVRLLAPLAAGLGSALLWRAAEDILPGRRAGVAAAALLNATLLLGVGAVTMTPDTPLLFFWCAALAALGRLLRTGRGAWWLAVGLAAGCALESKYTALLLGIGLALWLPAVPEGRRWLRTPWPWAGGALAALLFAPDLLWNAAHGWASVVRQGGRTADFRPVQALRFEAELLAGQLALATPLVLAACVAGMWRAARGWRDPGLALLAALTLPGAAVFLEHAAGDRVQANWPAVLYPAAAIAAGGLVRRWRPAAALGLVLAVPVYLQAAVAPLPLPRSLDPTLARLGGWAGLARQVSGDTTQGGASPLPLAADEYGLAAELAWQGVPMVLGVEPRWAAFDLPRVDLGERAVLLLRSERRREGPDVALWAEARQVGTLVRARAGQVAERYRLYRVVGRPGLVGTALPGPRVAAPPAS
jgi:4-amino-4-deoxy-L-arabinose transferase-like glycosyltransferase